jgi:uncharacterized phage protein gp47/JayE
MPVSTQSFKQIVSNAAAMVQGSAAALVDFAQGSISLAYMRAAAAIALWLQGLVLQVAALTRFATSFGPDADSWAADYNFTRLDGAAAIGAVTFSRYTPTLQALIPAGTLVQTADGTEVFSVIADTTQAAWNANLDSYVVMAGASSCNATVQAVDAGTGGNVAAGLITVIGQSIVGVDTVTNASAFANGQAEESDTAFKARFPIYLENLSQGTLGAVRNAIAGVQVGARGIVVENYNYSGLPQAGYFYVIADDGTGYPSGPFLTAMYAAIDAVRAEGTTFGVFAPSVVSANVAMKLVIAAGYTASTVDGQVSAALTAYINALSEGMALDFLRLPQIAFDTSPGVSNVPLSGLTLNGATADLTVSGQQLIRAGTITITN